MDFQWQAGQDRGRRRTDTPRLKAPLSRGEWPEMITKKKPLLERRMARDDF